MSLWKFLLWKSVYNIFSIVESIHSHWNMTFVWEIEKKSYIYLLFPTWWRRMRKTERFCGIIQQMCTTILTPIPWWLRTYFSWLPAMNFNESLPFSLTNFCHVLFVFFLTEPFCCHYWCRCCCCLRVLIAALFAISEWEKKTVQSIDEEEKNSMPNKTVELRVYVEYWIDIEWEISMDEMMVQPIKSYEISMWNHELGHLYTKKEHKSITM